MEFSEIPRLVKFGRFLRHRVDISRSLISVEFSKIPMLVKLGRLLSYRVTISRNFKLVNPSRFFRF